MTEDRIQAENLAPTPSREVTRSNAVVAEDIARLKTEVENKILSGIPQSDWRKAYEETLAQYPSTHQYKPLFDHTLRKAESAHEQIENLWSQYKNGYSSKFSEKQPGIEEGDPNLSRELFNSLFGFHPQGEVEAIKGAVTLRFMMDKDDFIKLDIKLGVSKAYATAYHVPGKNFDVLILQRDSEVGLPFRHELEHAKNQITFLNHYDSPFPEGLDMPEEILGKVKKRVINEHPMERFTRDELLAGFTEQEFVSPENKSQAILDYADWLIDFLKTSFSDDDKGYLEMYKKIYHPSQAYVATYVNIVKQGTDALKDLFTLYFKEGDSKAARMTINVLGQFPLRDWTAVVQLIKTRHAQKETKA